jgi:hypothetical protein
VSYVEKVEKLVKPFPECVSLCKSVAVVVDKELEDVEIEQIVKLKTIGELEEKSQGSFSNSLIGAVFELEKYHKEILLSDFFVKVRNHVEKFRKGNLSFC